jgi:peptide/nickel transport system substrate-binding protein
MMLFIVPGAPQRQRQAWLTGIALVCSIPVARPNALEVAMRFLAILLLFVVSCAPTASQSARQQREGAPASGAGSAPQKPLVIANAFEPPTLETSFGNGSGNREFGIMLSGYLAYIDYPYKVKPYLAAALPTLDDGSWKVLPDGRMETLYQLRPNLTFHDGKPLTAGDFAFGFQVRSNPSVPAPAADVEPFVAAVRVLDDTSFVIEWKQTYVWAAEIVGPGFSPMPRHLLEEAYHADLQTFINGNHWREDFVNSGPFKLDRWEPGVQMALRAFDGFALGKPGIDQIVMRFITDANVVVANLLSHTVDVAYSATINYPQGETLQQNEWAGKVEYYMGTPRYIHFQMRDWGNTQLAVHDLNVRRGMLHAVDRQVIVEQIYGGRTVPLDVWFYPGDPSFPAVDRTISKYPFDMGRAQQLLADAGWRRGGDGTLRNPNGDPLNMYILAHQGRVEEQETEAIASAWRSLGMPLDIAWLTPAQMGDGEYRSKYQAVTYDRRTLGYDSMVWTSDNFSGPENRWRAQNRNGYANPQLDEHWRKVLSTVVFQERERYLVEAFRVMTADAVVIPTHLQPRVMAYPTNLIGVKEPPAPAGYIANPWEWRWQ